MKTLLLAGGLVFCLVQLWFVAQSLRSGVIDWSSFGRKVRSPGNYDFWAVLAFHGTILSIIAITCIYFLLSEMFS
ncbi:hypothetical protein [Erythrobacter sp. CCH5-A1]|uniref:hypothetical protein n=1 Tax=Erythrobacter sp. CCH5-A1 TaxID=1768792 RepID=UPI00082F2F13|nr:hypothetical protein [Erythrobacter sp. CCH5-A1]